ALTALGIEPDSAAGYDFSGLDIGHLGHIYEGLLSLRLSLADRPYRYDARRERYVPAEGEEAEYEAGDLLWLTDEGGRKGGGVYYTPEPLVRHLVRRGVLPAFERHLERVAALVRESPARAARELFSFRVLDPACGSAHFLVAVVDELADRIARFLAEHPLPDVARELDDLRAGAGATYGIGVEDAALLRRLVLRRQVYGVDLSPMGAEIAKISLWLASFVPGLSLSYLDHNVRVGNSLIGVASPDQLLDADGGTTIPAMLVMEQMGRAAKETEAFHELLDRNPDEVERSEAADAAVQHEVEGARMLLDLWVAEPLGLDGARAELWTAAEAIGEGRIPALADRASAVAEENRVLHWPLAFPEVFASGRGFDAVVGNPPWEEVTVEELAFYARYKPGLRALAETERNEQIAALKVERPELEAQLVEERRRVELLKQYFYGETGYERGDGDPDLYKYFCQRYRRLLARAGALAVVLPRSAFSAKGSADFRRWLFMQTTVKRIDFCLNRRKWMFDTHPQYTIGLLDAAADLPDPRDEIEVAGVASSLAEFVDQVESNGINLDDAALGPLLEVPLLPSQRAADLLTKLRKDALQFPLGAGRWRCFPIRELDETDDKKLWDGATSGRPLWKGESFDQFDPHGAGARVCPWNDDVERRAMRRTAGGESILAAQISAEERLAAHIAESQRARVGFRRVTNRTNSRSVIAALVPPQVLLVNSVRYLVFPGGTDRDRACCLGILNSVPLDWQARRFVETDLGYYVLEGLRVPTLNDETYEAIATAAARLSCPDERFADFAAATDIEVGPLEPDERDALRAEIDARVAHAWGLDATDLETIFADFTLDAVPEPYRQRVRDRFAELGDGA
ncbi:MAG TPA: DNA methyltransferase, partial [Gaiellaceae bacterium]|nr:DNA methyltransferase [Gaiellaceae bacterium]